MWYEHAYRRNVVDMHITDWDARFLAQFDPETYVDMLLLCQARSAVVYAHSHVGHCYYPSRVGHMHRGLKGRDIFGEVLDLCHRQDIAVVAYYSLIYDDWAYRHNPDWRIILASGRGAAEHSRYGVCCPNSPYRDYAVAHAEELCQRYRFEGLRFDMTFWPAVCYCPHCRERFEAEVGGELPRVIHWQDQRWVAFQRRREAWLVAFAALMTSTVRNVAPQVTVEHQASTYMANWRFGVTQELARQCDFLQGDFYGDALQGSVARKLFHNLSGHLPYGFETSSSASLSNHTTIKPKELLLAKVSACLADGGAFVFIDAIDPAGTMHREVYERMAQVYEQTRPYEAYLGGMRLQDVAVYLSTESKFDPADDGRATDDPHLSAQLPHVEALLNVCKALIEHHVPFGVVTKRNLADLSRFKVLVLPNLLMMDQGEVQAIRGYVRDGGRLYASRYTSLVTSDGIRHADFLLGDVFGVSYKGETKASFTYITPASGAEHLFCESSRRYPLGIAGSQLVVQTLADDPSAPGPRVLGTLTLPYTDPADPGRYVSIHSNPPGIDSEYPSIVLNRYGLGQALYVACDLEREEIHRDTLVTLLGLLAAPFSFEADAPKAVEVAAFHQKEKGRFLVSLANFQQELPNIPVEGVRVRLRLGGRRARRLLNLPAETELPFEQRGDSVEFVAPRLETLAMFAVDYDGSVGADDPATRG